MPTILRARRYLVSGRVQGVGFRWFVREQARARALAGFVQNRADGSVIVEARGSIERLNALESALRSGPPGARVEEMEITDLDDPTTASLPLPFEIRR